MKTIRLLTIITMVSLPSVLFNGCTDIKEVKEEEKSSIILKEEETTVSPEEGDYSFLYTVEHPTADGKISASTVSDWITVTSTDTEGTVQFHVTANETESERTATIEVSYTGASEKAIYTVIQEKKTENHPDDYSITITVKEIQETCFFADIVPSDNAMYYIITIVPMQFITEGGFEDDDDALFEYEMDYYRMISNATGASLPSLIKNDAYTGPMENIKFTDLEPGTEYLVYSYGIDLEAIELMTEIARCPVTTKSPDIVEADFNLEAAVSGAIAGITASSDNYDGYYYIDVLSDVDSEDDIEYYCNNLWNDIRSSLTHDGYTPEEIIEEICFRGTSEKKFELSPNTGYYAVAFAINDDAIKNSAPSYIAFNTTDVLPSDNVITLEISEITSNSAKLSKTATNDDTYAIIMLESERVEGMSDEEILDYLVSGTYNLFKTHGDYTENVTGLEAGTGYVVAAFGYVSQTITTRLFKISFTTLE